MGADHGDAEVVRGKRRYLNFRADAQKFKVMIAPQAKRDQETFSLRHIGDNFRKLVVTGDPYEKPWTDRSGITFIGIVPFLLDPLSLEIL